MKTQRRHSFPSGPSSRLATLSLPFLLLLTHCGAPPPDERAEEPGPLPPAIEDLLEPPASELPAPTLPSELPSEKPLPLQPLDPLIDPALEPDPGLPPGSKGTSPAEPGNGGPGKSQ